MPTAAERLAQAHQRDVALIAGGVSSEVFNVALGADPAAVSTWFFAAVDGIMARITVGHAQTRLAGMDYLRRDAALHGVNLSPVPASLNSMQARTALRVTGPVAFKTAISAGAYQHEALQSMATQMSGSAQRLVMAGDRDTFERTFTSGRGIVGYRRVLVGKSCGFCAMLASRGAVYVSESSALVAKDGLKFHDHCNCGVTALYKHQQEPPEVQRLYRQWRRVTAGRSGAAAQREWRKHWEQRATPAARAREGIRELVPAPSLVAPSLPGAAAVGGTPAVAVEIRAILLQARTTPAVNRAFMLEAERITGRRIFADFQGSAATAREHAEGLLRGLERFPEAKLRFVGMGVRNSSSYAQASGDWISFSYEWSKPTARRYYLESLQRSSARVREYGEDNLPGFHPHGTGTPVGIALHEFGHVLDMATLAERIGSDVKALIERRVAAGPGDVPAWVQKAWGPDTVIQREISKYAATNGHELVAEAFADVMANGEAASALSREIFDLLEAEYRKGGYAMGSGAIGLSVPAPVADLSSLKLPELRALAKERSLTGYSKLTKPQLLERLGGEVKPVPKATPGDLSKLKVPELRALAKERGVTGYGKLTKPQLLEELDKPVPPPEDALVIAARERQAAIDYARARAELLSETEEWLNNQGTLASMAVQLRRDALRYGIEGHKDMAALFRAIDSGDEAKVRKAIEAVAKKQKLTRVERAGEVVKYDRASHGDIGRDLKPGEWAIVVRPGYTFDRNGEVIRLHKAKVEKATAKEIAAARGELATVPSYSIPKDLAEADLARIKDIIGDGQGISLSMIAVPGLGLRNLDLLLPWKARTASNAKELAQFVIGIRKKYPGLYDHLAHEAQVKTSYAEWRKVFKVKGSAAQVRRAMVEEMRSQLSDAAIVVRRRRESSLVDILQSGRMKTQFETGTSGGSVAPEMRAAFEQRTWGYARDLDPKLRPIYGYLSPAGVDAETNAYQAAQYGEIRIVLKDSVRSRTSFMVGDSLGSSSATPTAMDAPGWEAFNVSPGTGWRSPGGLGRDYGSEAFQRDQYVETQIHGGVTPDDIAEVVFTHGYTPSKETVDALRRANVPWRVSPLVER